MLQTGKRLRILNCCDKATKKWGGGCGLALKACTGTLKLVLSTSRPLHFQTCPSCPLAGTSTSSRSPHIRFFQGPPYLPAAHWDFQYPFINHHPSKLKTLLESQGISSPVPPSPAPPSFLGLAKPLKGQRHQ